MIRSFDLETAVNAAGSIPRNLNMDWEAWLQDHKNIMLVDGDDVGMGTYEYPGFYNVHWFFISRGKHALKTAKEMLDHFFTNYDVKAIRGLTPEHIKGARWLARQVGLKSYGILQFPDGPYELFCMTKEEFYKKEENE